MKKKNLLWLPVLLFAQTMVLAQVPSLVPMPRSVRWAKAGFSLRRCKAIVVNDTSLERLAEEIQHMPGIAGRKVDITEAAVKDNGPLIEIRLTEVKVSAHQEEAYRLQVTKGKIMLSANTPHGIFNGIQTLRQLTDDKGEVAGCSITDWPAFSWRGYMVDVGRNYQSVRLLKQQIAVMAHYKLNVFHLHLTEDIAWRLQVKEYPQLTAPENMLRDKGDYYSEADMKELIAYCRDRFITLVPEIDMPGHSAAFTRAMGMTMQSDGGLVIVKNILTEFCSTYDVPYLHIGADEVKVTNKDFIPEVVKLVHQLGKRTIGWDPGANYDSATVRQLWGDDWQPERGIRYIDSRGLYLNHMDPLESVVSIFERELCGVKEGDMQMLGGEICLWNDRRAAKEADLLRMNPVYPAMLAFAERSWNGGGWPGIVTDIGPAGSARDIAFREFENRLIVQKYRYFKQLPFPYVRQSDISWKLFGPFENGGELQREYWPERRPASLRDSTPAKIVSGGTIYLRHWWFPGFAGVLDSPKENTTWYAYTKLWSKSDISGYLWIGFDDFSRSTATDELQAGTWDNRKSCLWLNGRILPPPLWKNAGKKGNSELPLTDEGYSYRAPSKVHFKKGWNEILVKAPVGGFQGKDWQNPVKWMFTVVPVYPGRNN